MPLVPLDVRADAGQLPLDGEHLAHVAGAAQEGQVALLLPEGAVQPRLQVDELLRNVLAALVLVQHLAELTDAVIGGGELPLRHTNGQRCSAEVIPAASG